MLTAILVARRLGPEALGAIAYGTGLVGLVMAALLPGFGQAHVKRLAEGRDAGRCLGTMLAAQAAVVAGLVPLAALAWALGVFAPETAVGSVFALLLAAQIASRVADVYLAVFIVREWIVPHAAIQMGARVARLLATVAVVLWAPDVTLVAATFVVDGVLGTLGAALVLAVSGGIQARAPTRDMIRAYWVYARPLLVTTPLGLVQDSIDRVAVGWLGGLAAAGYYHIARALWEALMSVMAAPALFLFTRLSALYARRDAGVVDEARRFFFSGLDKLLFVSVPLALLVWSLAEWLIRLLYGAAFGPGTPALRILVVATLVANVVNPYTHVLYARDEVARFVPVNLLRIAVYGVVLVALVVADAAGLLPGTGEGATGAAVARLFLLAFPAWVYFRWTREVADIGLDGRVWLYFGSFAGAAIVERALSGLLGTFGAPAFGTTMVATIAALAMYLGVVHLAHPGASANFAYAWSLVSPVDLWNSLRGPGRIR